LSGDVAATLGSKAGGQGATDVGAEPDEVAGGSIPGTDHRGVGKGAPDGRDVQDFHASARVLFARPWVPAARAAVPTETRDRPNDTLDSSQEVAAKVSSLLQASSAGGQVGPGVGGERGGGAPGLLGAAGVGSRSSPSGAGFGRDFSDDPGFSGYARSLQSHLSRVLAKTFPDWAIEQGRGGHVIFDMTLNASGQPSAVRLIRPSGVAEYDQNVLRAVRAVSSFGTLPSGYTAPAQFRISWDALNPVVGREGPGPGGRPR
jgi:TonB family protein